MTALPEYISFLQKPSVYPHPVDVVELIQTHISYVTLAGDYVYKWKKPVNFGFLDFESLEKRSYYCAQEIVLNKRLCPEIYLEQVAIVKGADGGFALGVPEAGEVVEYGIKMKRMDDSRLMSKLLMAGEIGERELDAVVAKLVPFYRYAENSPELDVYGTVEAFGFNVHENFEQTVGFIGSPALSQDTFDRIKSWSLQFLDNTEIFNGRIGDGKIRDCHGDLYSANICFDHEVQIFDCIEFNERFRYGDVAADIAFLAMDLDYHGREDLSRYFVEQYVAKSGDSGLLEVLNFYKVYRAYVRAKIALFTSADPAVPQAVAEDCVKSAERYFQLALSYCK